MTAPPSTTKSGTPPTSERRLSEVARHVVLPVGITSTGWPAVKAKCRELGIGFQRWQDGAGRCILAKREDGLYAAGIGGAFMSIPRQVGKTYLIGAIVFALCLLHPGITVLWTAHRVRTANETFKSMQGMARRRKIKPFIEYVRRGSGEQGIEFKNGSRILFGARENGFGRGFANVSIVVFDEGQILTDDALDDMVPAANQAENPLILYIGTPPKPTDQGEVFTRNRRKALDGLSENTLYIEFSADPETDPAKWAKGFIDWIQVGKANPSFPRWTPRAAVLRMIEQLGLASFKLEGLGIWSEGPAIPPLIDADTWKALAITEPPLSRRKALGVRFSLDGAVVAVAGAQWSTDRVLVEGIRQESTAIGMAPLVDWIVARWRDYGAIVIDGKSGAGTLLAELARRGVSKRVLVAPSPGEFITSCSTFWDAVKSGRLAHSAQPGLTASVACGAQHQTTRGWWWESIADGDVLLLEAATLALWGAESKAANPPAPPKRLY